MKIYGLTQKVIKEVRQRFKDGELTFEEAMWCLSFEYSNNYIHDIKMEEAEVLYQRNKLLWNIAFVSAG